MVSNATFFVHLFQYYLQRFGILSFVVLTFSMTLVSNVQGQELTDGFMRGKHKANFAISYSHERYTDLFRGTERTPFGMAPVTTQSVNFFGAYGINDKVDVAVSLPYIKCSPSEESGRASDAGLQDLAAVAKWRFRTLELSEGSILAMHVTGGFSLPVGNYDPEKAIGLGSHVATASGNFILHYKRSSGFFSTLHAGYLLKEQIAADQWQAIAKAGFAFPKVYVDAWVHNVQAIGGKNLGDADSFQELAVSYTKVGGTVYVPLMPDFGMAFSSAWIFRGANLGASSRFTGSLVYQFNVKG